MNRKQFNQYIQSADFQELFVSEMGWNNPKGQTLIQISHIDDTDYEFESIAERNGFQILICQVKKIPSASICKKIDIKLRPSAHDYICIFMEPKGLHHEWVAPVNKVEKRDIVTIEYSSIDQAEFLFSKIADLSFGLDEQTTIMDVKQRIQRAFIVNSEKITKEFYTGFKKEHTQFVKYITGINDATEDKTNKEKQWYASVMLNRLMFCYFIQKKGFLDMNENYLREKLKKVQEERGDNAFFQSFYKGFLIHLFHEGLNGHQRNEDFLQKYGHIPYLNGGMFDFHDIEKMFKDIDIEDEAFLHLFDFFDKWRWHLDTRITASGKDINPDVLGYIFEQYINDRAQMGAYYTKEDITEYIGKNCILPFLFDAVKKTSSSKAFREEGYIWQTLQQSDDAYIYDAVKHGYSPDWQSRIPTEIAEGIDTSKPQLLERRSHWNERTPEPFNLPTEIWRETIERLQRCDMLIRKISQGEIHEINDFITYNLDIRQFTYDLLLHTPDHLLVEHFYHAMQRVTILDPTCGSGAFLFAAMNILEPLYEICISRMEEFHQQNKNLFVAELEEINKKYRSNIQYFIYKSIILRNLYGVDIMEEAVEIAKLRLFLKMVAVVEVNPRLDNLGLDPLPDIDFNIRCGNTLVGYATEEELDHDLTYGDMFARQEFKEEVEIKMDVIAKAYEQFKYLQLTSQEEAAEYKQSKQMLKNKLTELNDILNQKLFSSMVVGGNVSYEDWLKSHQPFHWLAEYYQIMHNNGGFDVIIGNPPYVESRKISYALKGYKNKYSNLYAYCSERFIKLITTTGKCSIIVPMSITSIRDYEELRLFVNSQFDTIYLTNHAIRPISLFEGVSQRVTICHFSNTTKSKHSLYTTKYLRTNNRTTLFKTLEFTSNDMDEQREHLIPKIGSSLHKSIWYKIHQKKKDISHVIDKNGVQLYYKDYGETYWIFPFNFIPYLTPVKSYKTILCEKDYCNQVFQLMNSSLFYIFHSTISDCWHFGNWHINEYPISIKELTYLKEDTISKSYISNRIVRFDSRINGDIYEYHISKSKPIIDEIDKLLAKHYGFTEEELDFIINYDIKYRMGDELNKDEE